MEGGGLIAMVRIGSPCWIDPMPAGKWKVKAGPGAKGMLEARGKGKWREVIGIGEPREGVSERGGAQVFGGFGGDFRP